MIKSQLFDPASPEFSAVFDLSAVLEF